MKLRLNLWFRSAMWVGTGLAAAAVTWIACAQGVSTTTVQGTVYLANGKPGSGSLQLSWPAFTTADNHAVAAGRTTAAIGQDGNVSVNLAPNLGSTPAGLYYTAVFHLSDGATSTEYWVVPPGDQVSIGQVRTQVMPAAQAVQAASKAYVDQAIQSVSQGSLTSTGGSLTGPLYLNGDPTLPLQAADKRYVDAIFTKSIPLTGGTMTGPLTLENRADAEIDYILKPGLAASQKGAFVYEDWNGTSQWSMAKDTGNNWALNSSPSGLDSLKAYQSSNGGDTLVNAASPSGVVRVNYESGSGSAFNIYGGGSNKLYASFSGASSIQFPGLAPTGGTNCLQIDSTGSMNRTGSPCSTASGTVGNGNAGQIAYYTGTGTSLGGTNMVPITAGGTGASTAAGAVMALGAASLATSMAQSFAGPLNAPSVSASVNSQINVMAAPYNAKGDCVHDDHDAIMSAQAAALATPYTAGLFFPKPPGGCYLTSAINWQGVGLSGQNASTMTIIRGMPGQDILHVQDPVNASYQWNTEWQIHNLYFQVDGSVATSVPHRYPGRWFDDGTMTAGSAVFKTDNGAISCVDIGQAIQVNGAGPSGTNLVTTISAVEPCMVTGGVWQKVTLAAAASTTVTGAHSYISVLNLPVTSTIGNCAIAFDNVDGLAAHWANPSMHVGNDNDVIHDVNIWGLYGMDNTCGIYTTGTWNLYGIDVQNLTIHGISWGIVQAGTELNSYQQGAGGDFQRWDHITMGSVNHAWVSYDGGYNHLDNVELTTTDGPQILTLGNRWSDYNSNWYIRVPEHEFETGIGWGVTGSAMTFVNNSFGGAKARIYTDNSVCTSCSFPGGADVGGSMNRIQDTAYNSSSQAVHDYGFGNRFSYSYSGNAMYGMPLAYHTPKIPMKRFDTKQLFGPDAISDGNPSLQYNLDDLVLWPRDVLFNSTMGSWSTFYQDDATSPTGGYTVYKAYESINNWQQFPGNVITVGKDVPAGKSTLSMLAKCPGGVTSATFLWGVVGSTYGYSAIGAKPLSCTTSYQVYSFTIDLTGYPGGNLFFSTTDNDLYAAWTAITPYKNLSGTLNGKVATGAGAALTSGPSSTVAGRAACFKDAAGTIDDCANAPSTTVRAPSGTDIIIQAGRALNLQDLSGAGFGFLAPMGSSSQGSNTLPCFQLGQTPTGSSSTWVCASYGLAGVWSNPWAGTPADWYTANLFLPGSGGQWNKIAPNPSASGAVYSLPPASGTLAAAISATTGSIGGSALAAGACASGTAGATGAATSMAVAVSPVAYPGDGYTWQGFVSASGTVTVKVCAIVAGTPAASAYNVRVIQ